MAQQVITTQDGHVQILRLNRPDKKNALTGDMYLGLADGLNAAGENSNTRVVLVTGTEGCFTAGNDIGDLLNQPAGDHPDGENRPFSQFIRALDGITKPVIAAVDGLAIGVGTTMLLHCDLVYAADNVRFHLPFTDLGLVPEAASSALLPQLAGYAKASEMLLLAEPFDANTALSIGLINRIFPAASLEQEALAIAHKLAAKPPQSVQNTKALIKKNRGDIANVIADELRVFTTQQKSLEAKEALSAFLERRTPDFSKF